MLDLHRQHSTSTPTFILQMILMDAAVLDLIPVLVTTWVRCQCVLTRVWTTWVQDVVDALPAVVVVRRCHQEDQRVTDSREDRALNVQNPRTAHRRRSLLILDTVRQMDVTSCRNRQGRHSRKRPHCQTLATSRLSSPASTPAHLQFNQVRRVGLLHGWIDPRLLHPVKAPDPHHGQAPLVVLADTTTCPSLIGYKHCNNSNHLPSLRQCKQVSRRRLHHLSQRHQLLRHQARDQRRLMRWA